MVQDNGTPATSLKCRCATGAGPTASSVELGQKLQEPAGGGGQVPGQLHDLRLHLAQVRFFEHAFSISRRTDNSGNSGLT